MRKRNRSAGFRGLQRLVPRLVVVRPAQALGEDRILAPRPGAGVLRRLRAPRGPAQAPGDLAWIDGTLERPLDARRDDRAELGADLLAHPPRPLAQPRLR